MKTVFSLAAAMLFVVCSAKENIVIGKNYFSGELRLGIRALPVSANRLHGSRMETDREIRPEERYEPGSDFFLLEYGSPCVFTTDKLREFGAEVKGEYRIQDGALQFDSGKKGGWSVLFGSEAGDNRNRPAVRIGRGWGKLGMNKIFLELDLEQSVESSQWEYRLERSWGRSARWEIKGKKRQKVRKQIGLVNQSGPWRGLRLTCRTPGNQVKIHSIRLVPVAGECYWFREFELGFEPVRAGIYFDSQIHRWTRYQLYVNGQLVSDNRPVRKCDLTPYLKKGRNSIVFRDEFDSGYGSWSNVLLEVFAVGRNGEKVVFGGDEHWRWTYRPEPGWEKAEFSPRNWNRPRLRGPAGVDRLRDGSPVALGLLPEHPGLLKISPLGEKYPVFDYDGPVGFQASIPAGVRNAVLKLRIRNAETGVLEETLSVSANREQGDFRLYEIRPKIRKTGAYQMLWSLERNGEILDSDRTEMILCGPLPQKTVPYPAFEKELEKQLLLLESIDCTREYPQEKFLDHSGRIARPRLNAGRVVTRNGMTYREAGPSSMDAFQYAIRVGTLGRPHLVEVDYPDNEERCINLIAAETYPLPFENNSGALGSKAWTSATASVATGGLMTCSMKMQKLRFVIFPASKNVTISVQTHVSGRPAAASAIRVYALKGDLPALQLPKTGRTYAHHNERFLAQQWGAEQDPRILGFIYHKGEMREGFWTSAYLGICNKLRFLRFAGHNASVEGIYMYQEGFPSQNGNCRQVRGDDFDPFVVLLKMYKHNGIRTFLGFEYIVSPKLIETNQLGVSDRELRAGTARPLYHVSRYGKQVGGFGGHGLNHLNPVVWQNVREVVDEIYHRYSGLGDVAGLFLVCGRIWLPGYPFGDYGQFRQEEIGYDDDSIEQFERETGIRLSLPMKGVERFGQRYRLLTGKFAKQWFAWRSKKIMDCLNDIQSILRSGNEKWELFPVPQMVVPRESPFTNLTASKTERDVFFHSILKAAGYDPDLYGAGKSLRMVPHVKEPRSRVGELAAFGLMTNDKVRELYRKNDAVYLSDDDLNELIHYPVPKARRWWWEKLSCAVYERMYSGEFAFHNLVNLLSGHVPKHLFRSWLDVNETTGHTEQTRRFLNAFYSIPEAQWQPCSGIQGVQAKSAGNALLLINNTPYPVSGTIQVPGKAEITTHSRKFQAKTELSLKPYDLAVIWTEGDADRAHGLFRFRQDVEKMILKQARILRENPEISAKLPAETVKQIADCAQRGDFYGCCTILRSFETFRFLKRFLESENAFRNQDRLEAMLKQEKAVRINCGALEDYRDPEGRLWLPDQAYAGFRFYGNEYAGYAVRGRIDIAGTKNPGIYRTEAYGAAMYYHIPLPDGVYRLKLHFAETYRPDFSRQMRITVPGNPVRMLNTREFGFRTARVEQYDAVVVENGCLTIQLENNALLNGIELEVRSFRSEKGEGKAAARSLFPMDGALFQFYAEGRVSPEQLIPGFRSVTGNVKMSERPRFSFLTLEARKKHASVLFLGDSLKKDPRAGTENLTISLLCRFHGPRGHANFQFGQALLSLQVENGMLFPYFIAHSAPEGEAARKRLVTRFRQKPSIPAQEWHYLKAIVNRDDAVKLYVDGHEVGRLDIRSMKGIDWFRNSRPLLHLFLPLRMADPGFKADIAFVSIRRGLLSLPMIQRETAESLNAMKE